jgi:DNA-binding NarL/FixJ family response regulator
MEQSVVLIDDDSVVHIIATSILGTISINASSSTNLTDGLNLLNSLKQAPLAIFCDLNLPDGIGLSIIMPAKKLFPSTPFLIMSSEQIPEEILKDYTLLPDLFLPKPFTPNDLIEAIEFCKKFST